MPVYFEVDCPSGEQPRHQPPGEGRSPRGRRYRGGHAQSASAIKSRSGASGVARRKTPDITGSATKASAAASPAAGKPSSEAVRMTAQPATNPGDDGEEADAERRVAREQCAGPDEPGDGRRMIEIARGQVAGPFPVVGLVGMQRHQCGHDEAHHQGQREHPHADGRPGHARRSGGEIRASWSASRFTALRSTVARRGRCAAPRGRHARRAGRRLPRPRT